MTYDNMTRDELIYQLNMLKKNIQLYELQEKIAKDEYYSKIFEDNDDNFWRTILDNIPMTVYINGVSGILWINKYCIVDSGYSPEEWMNFTSEERFEKFHPDDMNVIYDINAKLIDQKKVPGQFLDVEYRVKCKNGKWKWFYSTFSYIYDKNSKEIKSLATALDIDIRKEQEAKIISLNNELAFALEKERNLIKEKESFFNQEILNQQKQLNQIALLLAENNNFLLRIKNKISIINPFKFKVWKIEKDALINEIEQKLEGDDAWASFKVQFDSLNPDFTKKLLSVCSQLSNTELKICLLISLNLATKNIATFLNISSRTVETHRLNIRKKLKLNKKESLVLFFSKL